MKSRRAFTLIELLVVVAIIALLIALLLPALAKAKNEAKKTVCLSHEKGIGIAFFSYGGNNNSMVPDGGGVDFQWVNGQVLPGTNADEESWPEVLVVDGDVNVKFHNSGATAVQDNFAQGAGIFWCPCSLVELYTEGTPAVTKTGKPDGTPESGQSGYGMGYYAASLWYFDNGGAGSNGSWTPPIPIGGQPNASGKLVYSYTMKTQYWRAGGIVLMEGDTGFNGAIGAGGADCGGRYSVYTSRHASQSTSSGYPLGANYLLGDGHAEFSTTWNLSDTPGQSGAKTFLKYPQSNWNTVGSTQMPKDYSVWGHNPNGQNGASGP